MKNIAITILDEDIDSGVYQYSLALIEALILDCENNYLLYIHKNNTMFDHLDMKIIRVDINFTIFDKILMYLLMFFNIRNSFFLNKEFKEKFNNIELFITPYISFMPHYFLNKNYIFTLHDMQEKYFPEFFTKKEVFKRNIVNSVLSKNAKFIICESEYVKKDIIKYLNIDPEKIIKIPAPPPNNFSDFIFDGNKASQIKEKYNLPEKYLYYPAQFWRHKNHIELFRALQILIDNGNDICLVLTGSKQNYFDIAMTEAEKFGIKENIYYLGYVDYDELPYLYKMSKMLVMPSLHESISIPIFEALSLSIPVCASNVVAIPEQVGESGLTFDPKSCSEIANKISILLSDNNLRNRLSINGIEKMKKLNKDMYKIKLIELINNVL